jgi:DUF1365 family protein
LFYIDLDELSYLFDGVWGWSLEQRNFGCFRRADYLGDPAQPLKDEVKKECAKLLGYSPQGAVRMVTNLRIWGLCFNPVTFYYLFDQGAENPKVILAQVNNTPWDERHVYALVCDAFTGKVNTQFEKQFHVSPFNPLDMDYRWISTVPADQLVVHMENHAAVPGSIDKQRHMDATLTLERHPWNKQHLQRLLWQQPWMTLKVPVAIYWQALKLFFKGVPCYGHRKVDSQPISTDSNSLKTTGESS